MAADGLFVGETEYVFGPYRLNRQRRLLTREGRTVPVRSRALELLLVLLDKAGTIVAKHDLIAEVWPDTHVDDVNLRVHINAIRKCLNDSRDVPEYISNVAGRGYQFIADVTVEVVASARAERPQVAVRPESLPIPSGRVVGRDDVVAKIGELVGHSRLVTIVGPGGIGKTTVALVVAGNLRARFPDGVHFVDFASATDPRFAVSAVAAALQAPLDTDDPLTDLVRNLKSSNALLVFDNCEHLIDVVAGIAEGILRAAPAVRILATSHEPIRVEGEWTHRLAPLDGPRDPTGLSLALALRHPAVELFVDRMSAGASAHMPDDADVPHIVEICRRLDGLPLALEIAAANAATMPVAQLVARLDQRLGLAAPGRQVPTPRHHTLNTLLDWSYDTLTPLEQAVLRRLSAFPGAFDLDGAVAVAGDDDLNAPGVGATLASLVRKSLVWPVSGSSRRTYRLLETTRLYAGQKAEAALETSGLRRRHARYLLEPLARAELEWRHTPRRQWLEIYGPVIDDVRVALTWAFSPDGDERLGVRLTAMVTSLALQAGFADEVRQRATLALAHAADLEPPELVAEIRLNTVFGLLGQNQVHPTQGRMASLRRALDIAERIPDGHHSIEPLVMMGSFNLGLGDYSAGYAYAIRAGELGRAIGDELATLSANRVLAQTSHFAGEHHLAAGLAGQVLTHPVLHIPFAYGNVQTDKRVSMRIILARVAWMQGRADEASLVAQDAVQLSAEDGPLALAQAYALAACPIALWRGDNEESRAPTARLASHSERYGLGHWASWAGLFDAVRAHRITPRRETIAATGDLQIDTLATFVGDVSRIGLDRIDEANWAAPELLRCHGERLLAAGGVDARAQAEAMLHRGMACARRHGALAWELRLAISFARLWTDGARRAEGLHLLGSVYSRFSEGFATADMLACETLMEEMETA